LNFFVWHKAITLATFNLNQ